MIKGFRSTYVRDTSVTTIRFLNILYVLIISNVALICLRKPFTVCFSGTFSGLKTDVPDYPDSRTS